VALPLYKRAGEASVDFKLAKCARCDKIFNKIVSEVCGTCQPEEDSDFSRIHHVISRTPGLKAQQVAEEAEVSIQCVLRMMKEGRIDHVENDDPAKCGRCGAPAISLTKRLCDQCLVIMDRECAHAMLEMRQRIRSKEESDMHDVRAAISNKRASKKAQRDIDTLPEPSKTPVPRRRMVVQERLRKK
jgi:hypothetical protein